jgi:hypothetical protein
VSDATEFEHIEPAVALTVLFVPLLCSDMQYTYEEATAFKNTWCKLAHRLFVCSVCNSANLLHRQAVCHNQDL